MPQKAGRIHIGVGGWTYEPWRGTFYPDGLPLKRELEYAGSRLTSIEINGTYYGSQKPESFAKWREATPDGFVFALKGPRFTTNRRVLAEAGASVERFVTSGITELKDKLGPINWQFLPTKKYDAEDFARFLALLPGSHEGLPLRHAVELRHDSFASPDLIAAATEHGVAVVTAVESGYPQIADLTAPFAYLRLMGTREAAPAGYDEATLDRWAARLRSYAAGAVPEGLATFGPAPSETRPREVFAYVISGFKTRNPAAAMALIDRVGKG